MYLQILNEIQPARLESALCGQELVLGIEQ